MALQDRVDDLAGRIQSYRNSQKQQQWAHDYLQGKNLIEQKYTPSTHEELLRIGEDLERSRAGSATIQRMRNAWRQMEYRAPGKGRKACTFKLKTEAKKVLASLAKKNSTNETDMLSILISDAAGAHAGLKVQLDKLQEKTKKLSRSNIAAMDLFEFTVAMLCRTEVLLHDALSTVVITQDQECRIEKIRKQVWNEAKADIAASADETVGPRLRASGRLCKAMREEKQLSRLVVSKTAENTKTTAQTRLTDLRPVTYEASESTAL